MPYSSGHAAQNKIAVVARGSGTGLSGGSVPVPGCIVLCLVQMDRVLSSTQRTSARAYFERVV